MSHQINHHGTGRHTTRKIRKVSSQQQPCMGQIKENSSVYDNVSFYIETSVSKIQKSILSNILTYH